MAKRNLAPRSKRPDSEESELPELGNEPFSQPGVYYVDPANEGIDEIEEGPPIQATLPRRRGLEAVEDALRLESFPIERSNIDYSVGDMEVEDGRGGWIEINVLTDQLKDDRYNTLEDAMGALIAARDLLARRRVAS